jgi:uncharacterized protein YecE (DUF72 family)
MGQKYFLGCSGWYYDHWIGSFYPEDIKKREWLSYYSKFFNTVEINNTFYHFPSIKNLKSWYIRTPRDFVFTLKANRLITHRKKFKETKDLIDRFYELADHLEEKLGCILFQLPPMLKKDIELLESISEQLDLRRNNVLEFRDDSWFCEDVYDFLRKKSIIFCIISAPNLPKDAIKTVDLLYMRFHGKNNWYKYLYNEEELSEWKNRILNLNPKRIFCYFNNDYHANAIKNCKQLQKILKY